MGVRLFGGGQAPPLVKSGVLSLVGAAPVLSPNVLKIPMLATLSCWRSGAPAGGEAAMHATAAAKAGPNLLMFFIAFFLSCQVKSSGSCFLVFALLPARASTHGRFPELSAGFSGHRWLPSPRSSHSRRNCLLHVLWNPHSLYTC